MVSSCVLEDIQGTRIWSYLEEVGLLGPWATSYLLILRALNLHPMRWAVLAERPKLRSRQRKYKFTASPEQDTASADGRKWDGISCFLNHQALPTSTPLLRPKSGVSVDWTHRIPGKDHTLHCSGVLGLTSEAGKEGHLSPPTRNSGAHTPLSQAVPSHCWPVRTLRSLRVVSSGGGWKS